MDSQANSRSRLAVGSGFDRVRGRLAPVGRWVRRRFEVDTRALAAMRISLGLIILIDLLYRATALEMFYTDAGAYPRGAFAATYTQYNDYSLHALSGDLWFQALLFVVAGLFAVAFVLGYRTRLVGLISLLFLFSLQARNPAVLNGGDRLFRVLLAVSLVAPLGERWSIDALRRGSARETVASFGTMAVVIQPLVVFTSNAMMKHEGEHWYAGEALEIALANDVMTIYLGNVLIDYPTILTALNYVWVTILAGSVVFLLLPGGRLRALAALGYMCVFSGMIVTMSVGLFPLLLITSVMPFLTTQFWEWVGRRVPERWKRRVPGPGALGPLGRPPIERRALASLRQRGYDFAATYTVTYARSLLTVIGLMVVVWILLFSATSVSSYDVPDEVDYTHLDQQSWGLYAPDPSESYAWFVNQAQLADGSTVDALDGGAVDFDRPPNAASEYDSFRHRKFMQTVNAAGRGDTNGAIAKSYADWVCEQAASRYDREVEQVTVYQMYQPSPIDGGFEEPSKVTVIERECQ